MNEITRVLEAAEKGDGKAARQLLPLLYDELRKLAAAKMAREAPGQTLQPTELVHEAWLRVVGGENRKFANRAHFFAAAAEAMRRILIDTARRKQAIRHGGGQQRVDIDTFNFAAGETDEQILLVHEALDKFAHDYPRPAELVKLRYFVGLTNEEAAAVLNISLSTVSADWAFARAWLYQEIGHCKQE